jgi:hypothetical protein
MTREPPGRLAAIDEPENGYDPSTGRTDNILVHLLSEVNQALKRDEYFGPTSLATASCSTGCPVCESACNIDPIRG